MSSKQQLKGYFEDYWSAHHRLQLADRQGYAAHFRNWIHDEMKNLPRDIKVLDVGCGDGIFTKHLTEYASQVAAVDLSSTQVTRNTEAHPGITFLEHDLADPLPFPAAVFDVILCTEVLGHLVDPLFALQEMHRVMAWGGRLLLTVPYHGRFKNVLIALFTWDRHYAPTGSQLRFFSQPSLQTALTSAGFHIGECHTCGARRPLRDLFIASNLLLTARKL